jgi:hypothetical protein
MKTWPRFDAEGDLPQGTYPATLLDVLSHFGASTPQRERVARRLEHIYMLAVRSGHVARFVIFGSFVTAKPAPNDIDIFLLMDDAFDVEQLPNSVRIVFDHTAAQNLLGGSVFWIRRFAALGGEEAARSLVQASDGELSRC